MNINIVTKTVLCIVGVLVLIQLLFYNAVRSGNLTVSQDERLRLQQEVAQLNVEKQELQQYLEALQQEYRDIAVLVPGKILQGYEDHEVMLAGFLDYIKGAEFDRLDAGVTMQGARKYISKPVPLFEHDMTFDFTFSRLSDARKFLALVLEQDLYPLVVRKLELRSSGERKISGALQTSLLIPARLQQPLLGIR
jgi:hypothetical protein